MGEEDGEDEGDGVCLKDQNLEDQEEEEEEDENGDGCDGDEGHGEEEKDLFFH